MRRRDVICALAAATTWPLASLAQPATAMRRIGVLLSTAESDSEGQARIAAFRNGLRELGWIEGHNVQLQSRWAAGNPERMRAYADELVGLTPELILAAATTALVFLQRATHTIPIVFAQVTDPVEAGFVQSLARPGGNITGLTQHEFTIGVKWLELLKELAPRVTRVAALYDPENPTIPGYLRAMQPAAASLGLQVLPFAVRAPIEITAAIEGFVREPNGGLVVMPGPVGAAHRELIIGLAERHRLPAVYAFRYHVVSGGLASYGVDNIDLYRRAAWYADRILKGDSPAVLPVQHATKFELVLNMKTARALGLDPPLALLARTDEVIE